MAQLQQKENIIAERLYVCVQEARDVEKEKRPDGPRTCSSFPTSTLQ